MIVDLPTKPKGPCRTQQWGDEAAHLLLAPGGWKLASRWPVGLLLAIIRQVGLAPLLIHATLGKHKLPIQSSGAWPWVGILRPGQLQD